MRARSALCLAFERAGFTLVREKGHKVWRCPCGHAQVVTAGTPGEGRAARNARALMSRTLRACAERRRFA